MNEGFRALPKEVQKKILGKAMGGVMQRPLFRQMGGPAEPMPQDMMQAPPMPQGMMQAPPNPQEMVQEAEMAGERVGEQIAAATMTNIDSATDVKGAIDALRGNAAPLEARYQELAGLVGKRDALQTPESVLALTQPAIMMTEQGAMDSGIGELMQTVAGDTEMSGGMDQGVGALMMQGAGNTPPENFRQGGPVMVRHFQDGTPPEGNRAVPAIPMMTDFDPFMERAMAAREGILGTPEERAAQLARAQQSAKSDAMFNLANFGLAFAGETEGGTVAERLANAARKSGVVQGFQQAGKDVEAARSAQEQQDTSLKLSALERAEEDADKFSARQFEFARMEYEDLLKDGNILAQNALDIEQAKTKQNYALALEKAKADARARLDKANNAFKAAESVKDRGLTTSLQRERQDAEIALFNLTAMTNLENDLFKMGVKNVYDLDMMGAQTDASKDIALYKDGLETAAREDQQAFDAIEKQLDRMERFDIAELQDNVRLEISNKEITQRYTIADQNRELQRAQNAINNAFKNDEILQKDRQLNITEAKNLHQKTHDAKKLAIDAAAAKLKTSEIKNKYQLGDYLNSTDEAGNLLVDKFMAGEMNEQEADTFERRLLMYTKPTKDFDESSKTFRKSPGLQMGADFNEKLKSRPDLYSQVTGKTFPELVIGDPKLVRNILFEDMTEDEVAEAFGSDAYVKNLVNLGMEALSFGYARASFPKVKDASAAVKNLNDDLGKYLLKISEVRDSVFQAMELKDLVPKPTAFWTGDDTAASMAKGLAGRLLMEERRLIRELTEETLFLDATAKTEKEADLQKIRELRAGYDFLTNISELAGVNTSEADNEQEDYFQNLYDKFKGKPKGEDE